MTTDRVAVIALPKEDWFAIQERMRERERSLFETNIRSGEPWKQPTFAFFSRLVLITSGGSVVGIGLGRSRGRSGDLDRLVRVEHVWSFEPLAFEAVERGLPPRVRASAMVPLTHGGLLGERGGAGVLHVLGELVPGLREVLRVLRAQLASRAGVSSGPYRTLQREQRDALALGLELSGISSRSVLSASVTAPGEPFLSSSFMASEASIVRHDVRSLDGWLSVDGRLHDVVEFVDPQDSSRRATAFYADKEGLELVTGTDLVYFVHHARSFVLVQYKRLGGRSADATEPPFYRPDAHFSEEVRRMRSLLRPAGPPKLDTWRLHSGPFYVKLADSDRERPDAGTLVRGMYFPLDLFELLLASDGARGPRGGTRVGWANAGRYLSNTEFVGLVRNGWIGSEGATTAAIRDVVNALVGMGHGVVGVLDESERAVTSWSRRPR